MIQRQIFKIELYVIRILPKTVVFIGNSKDSASNSTPKQKDSNSKESDDIKESDSKKKEDDKNRKQSVSFPPSNTADSVRLKSRELLANALRQGKSKPS